MFYLIAANSNPYSYCVKHACAMHCSKSANEFMSILHPILRNLFEKVPHSCNQTLTLRFVFESLTNKSKAPFSSSTGFVFRNPSLTAP